MEAIRGWIEVIQGGGWNGLLMAGFAVVAAAFGVYYYLDLA